jgi:hypothetical protein
MLQFYCFLLLLFAANGSLEAYYFAIAEQSRIRLSLASQVAAFAVFVIVAHVALPSFGALAILLGNAASMLLRSVCCLTIFEHVTDPIHPQLSHVALRIAAGAAASHIALLCLPSRFLPPDAPMRTAVTQCGIVGCIALITVLSIRSRVAAALSSVKSS